MCPPGTDKVHSVLKGGARYYYATDRQGSVLALIDGAGTVVSQYQYDSFGGAEYVSEGVANRLRWIGREWDPHAGLYYVRARWYEPTLQRFISEDPIGVEGGINLYAYSENDPVNFSDHSGLMPTCNLELDFTAGTWNSWCSYLNGPRSVFMWEAGAGRLWSDEWVLEMDDWLSSNARRFGIDYAAFMQGAGNFSAGFGDFASLGATRWVRRQIAADEEINYCSATYGAGEIASMGVTMAAGVAGGVRSAGTKT